MTDGRKRLVRALTTFSLVTLAGTVLTASPSVADPSIDDVQERVDTLHREAEQASERYNDARIRLTKASARLDRLQDDIESQQDEVDLVREQVVATVVAHYQGEPLSAASSVLLSDDPDAFISQMTTISQYTADQAQVAEDLGVELGELEEREAKAERTVEAIAETKAELADEKVTIEKKAGLAEKLLERLEDEAAERASRSETRTSTSTSVPDVSGSAGAAVQYALAQVGDAYVYGAAGPDAFDCSGLTMAAWAQGGVALPHSSSAQMSSGTPVSTSALQPGDLVFYYSPVSHVGIYVGNGMIAHAANPSTDVRVDPVSSMPISGAVRPG